MTPRITATIALRIIGLLLLLWSLSDLATMVLLLLSSHSAGHGFNPIIAPSFDRTHGAPPALAFPWSPFPRVVMRLVGGLVLFFLSKRLGKLVARGLE
jgi:hypothetical protein